MQGVTRAEWSGHVRPRARALLSELDDWRRRELLLCTGIAATISLLVLKLVPPGGDAPAHLYRTLLVRQGVFVWDNLWFAGQYPLFSYSLLYYLPAPFVGDAWLGLASIVIAVLVFASIVVREWGALARWPARSFAVLAAGQLFTGAYPFDAGLACLLATLWALQRRRFVIASVSAILTVGFSPLAFLLLGIALVAAFLATRRVSWSVAGFAVAVLGAIAIEAAVLVLFPSPGLVYPFGLWRLLAGLAVAFSGVALALRARRARKLALLFGVWAVASAVAYLVPSAVGHNILRASTLVFPLMLLTAALAGFRPRWLAVPAVAGALVATVGPYVSMIPARSGADAAGTVAFWRPILAFLGAHPAPGYRVEVVPTSNHWEAYFVPQAGLALARGWYRQLDIAANPALYQAHLSPSLYRAWLREEGVRYVVLPNAQLEAIDAAREARLLRSGAAGLRRVWSGPSGVIFALPHAKPILTGPGRATITTYSSTTVSGSVARPGSYLLRVHYTPYWHATAVPSVCVAPAQNAMTRLVFSRAGPFSLRAIEDPVEVLGTYLHSDGHSCPAAG